MVGLHRSRPHRRVLQHALRLGIRRVDTASNYQGGRSHELLCAAAGPRLAELVISTKVGYFPDRNRSAARSRHSLVPAELRRAIEHAVSELGAVPATVFLHNPEHSLAGLAGEHAANELARACAVLRDAVTAGWCGGWGISCWSASRLLPAVNRLGEPLPVPSALMVRAGLSVSAGELAAIGRLVAALGATASSVWGMAPFGAGTVEAAAWTRDLVRPFLADAHRATAHQGACRVAFEVPPVARLAVGVSSVEHLQALYDARSLALRPGQVERYRRILAARSGLI